MQLEIRRTMNYARARLWLGITGVGTLVTLCALLVFFQLPQRFLLAQPAAFPMELRELFLVLVAYVAISAPFDFFGGFVLPGEFGRSQASFGAFFPRWLRGVVLPEKQPSPSPKVTRTVRRSARRDEPKLR